MSQIYPAVDPNGLLEYSVVFSDRSVNHMSELFQQAMRDISAKLADTYNAEAVVVVPGGGSFAMESVARQFAGGQQCLVLRNGWFSFRWSQIFDMGGFAAGHSVLKARQQEPATQSPWLPAPIEDVEAAIERDKPAVVFAPHVETSSGMMLADDYIRRVGDAVHAVGGLFVLDCVASGSVWIDMQANSVDVLISAPQKGWSSTPCAGLVMLSSRAVERMEQTTSSSFAADLKKWRQIMQAYENGGHAYHATMPTEGLIQLRDSINATLAVGLEPLREAHLQLGGQVRELLASQGYPSVAAEGYGAPGVVVAYTSDADMANGKKFAAQGIQSAAGVPLQCGERDDFMTFRIGLFGLDKLQNIDATVDRLRQVLSAI